MPQPEPLRLDRHDLEARLLVYLRRRGAAVNTDVIAFDFDAADEDMTFLVDALWGLEEKGQVLEVRGERPLRRFIATPAEGGPR